MVRRVITKGHASFVARTSEHVEVVHRVAGGGHARAVIAPRNQEHVAVGHTDSAGDAAEMTLLLSDLNETAWSINALFFGLWLIPMGWLVLRSGWMPRILGWTLLVGGIGYIASCALDQLRPQDATLVETLTMPASIGEFSMIAYLLYRGVTGRSGKDETTTAAPSNEKVTQSTAV